MDLFIDECLSARLARELNAEEQQKLSDVLTNAYESLRRQTSGKGVDMSVDGDAGSR